MKEPTTRTVVQRQATLTDPDQARRILDSALSESLGRRATQVEIDDFQVALNDAQRITPSVTTTTYDIDADGNTTGSSGVTEGGIDPAQYADNFSKDGDMEAEHGAYQAATTYAQALFSALGSPV